MSEATLRILDRAEVARRLPPIADQIALAAATFRALAAGRIEMPPKIGIHPRPDAFIHAMPAYLRDQDVAAIKWVAGYPENPSRGLPYINGLMIVNDPATGVPRVVCDAGEITAARTAAASGACIGAFAPAGWRRAAILGAGEQGRYHAAVLRSLQPDCEIAVYDPVRARAEQFAPGAQVTDDPRRAVAGAGIVITAGPLIDDPTPVITADWLPAACLVLPVDVDFYVTAGVAAAASRLIADDVDQYRYFQSLGRLTGWPAAREALGAALDSAAPATGHVVCVNIGLGALDAAFAHAVCGS